MHAHAPNLGATYTPGGFPFVITILGWVFWISVLGVWASPHNQTGGFIQWFCGVSQNKQNKKTEKLTKNKKGGKIHYSYHWACLSGSDFFRSSLSFRALSCLLHRKRRVGLHLSCTQKTKETEESSQQKERMKRRVLRWLNILYQNHVSSIDEILYYKRTG